ncbi:MAG: FliA/WhiG family RNA polymerase sigma factor [Acidobacteria bacterium]|nr:FliA/WhiG family RNA polymerase sigma factor [Acidobacteriota bacterium]
MKMLDAFTSDRVTAGLPFVEALARRMVSTMPHSVEVGDLVQDGVLGLIDAAQRFDEARGIKFETFAERRIRGAMIDALRKDAWPRGMRRIRRDIEAARVTLRERLGHEPSLADLAEALGKDEDHLQRTIVRIATIESTSAQTAPDVGVEYPHNGVLVPAEPARPDAIYEADEQRLRVRKAMASLPARDQQLIALYYFRETTMKAIGEQLGVNESRVSQLHTRALRRLREAMMAPPVSNVAVAAPSAAVLPFPLRPGMARATLSGRDSAATAQPMVSRTARTTSVSLKGFESQRQAVSSRKRSASVPTTSPVTKMTRRASAGMAAAMAR